MLRGSRLLREWRLRNDLTQTEAAARIESSAAAWCGWENNHPPKLAKGSLIAELTGGEVPLESWAIVEPDAPAENEGQTAAEKVG